jgi:hypothetical protein
MPRYGEGWLKLTATYGSFLMLAWDRFARIIRPGFLRFRSALS